MKQNYSQNQVSQGISKEINEATCFLNSIIQKWILKTQKVVFWYKKIRSELLEHR